MRPAIYVDGWLMQGDRVRRATLRERFLWLVGLLRTAKV
jgi:hypothetical protein